MMASRAATTSPLCSRSTFSACALLTSSSFICEEWGFWNVDRKQIHLYSQSVQCPPSSPVPFAAQFPWPLWACSLYYAGCRIAPPPESILNIVIVVTIKLDCYGQNRWWLCRLSGALTRWPVRALTNFIFMCKKILSTRARGESWYLHMNIDIIIDN